MRILLVLVLCGVAAFTAHVTDDHDPHLRACVTEDSDNCVWDASTHGNGRGVSFVSIDGRHYYAGARP